MKAKVKIDADQIKGMLIRHVEKIVFGVFVLIFVVLCYGAVGKERYQKRPADLAKEVDAVKRKMETEVYRPGVDLPLAVSDPSERLAVVGGPIDVASIFPRPPVLDLPIFEPKSRRNEPKYLPPLELQVGADYGPIVYAGDPNKPLDASTTKSTTTKKATSKKAKEKEKKSADPYAAPSYTGAAGAGSGGPRGPGGSGGGYTGAGSGGPRPGGGMGATMSSMAGDALRQGVAAPPGSDVKGRNWVVLTGLVPVDAQMREFTKVFENAMGTNPAEDYPNYVFFEIQRAEVQSAAEPGEQDWKSINVIKALKDMYNWGEAYPEIADQMYLEQAVCEPLPPLTGKSHDKSVVHSKIPLSANAMVAMDEEDEQEKTDAEKGDKTAAKPQANATGAPAENRNVAESNPLLNGGGPGMRSGAGGYSGGMGGSMRPPMSGAGGYSGGMRPPMSGGGGYSGGMGGSMRPPTSGMGGYGGAGMGGYGGNAGYGPQRIEYKMLRFFDFDVKPGLSYRYRVRLILSNPNFGVPAQYLSGQKIGEGETRTTDWSKPSPMVTTPLPDNVLAGTVKPPGGTDESMAFLMLRHWDAATPVDASHEQAKIVRGTVANFDNVPVMIEPPGRPEPEEKKLSFDTNTLVLDMVGGEQVQAEKRKAAAPSEVLVLTPDGSIEIKSQMADFGAYQTEKQKNEALTGGNTSTKQKNKKDKEAESNPYMSMPGMGKSGAGKAGSRGPTGSGGGSMMPGGMGMPRPPKMTPKR